jgi:hypothetical protein
VLGAGDSPAGLGARVELVKGATLSSLYQLIDHPANLWQKVPGLPPHGMHVDLANTAILK